MKSLDPQFLKSLDHTASAVLLFGVSPHDPLTYGGLGALLVGLAAAAAYLPARRATALSPVDALR